MSGMCAAIGVWVGVWGGAVGEQSPQAGAVALGPGWVGGGPGPQSRVRKWALRPALHALTPWKIHAGRGPGWATEPVVRSWHFQPRGVFPRVPPHGLSLHRLGA